MAFFWSLGGERDGAGQTERRVQLNRRRWSRLILVTVLMFAIRTRRRACPPNQTRQERPQHHPGRGRNDARCWAVATL